MEFFRFIFSSFWTWVGFLLLLAALCGTVSSIIREIKKPKPEEIKRAEAEIEYWKCEAAAYKLGFKRVEKQRSESRGVDESS